VTVRLVLAYQMQCGYPGPGPLVVVFPAGERLPARMPASAVLLDGRAAPAVGVSGHSVRIGFRAPPQVMCDVLTIGRLEVVFTRDARLGNPPRAGGYRLGVTKGVSSAAAPFAIRPA